MPGTGPSEKGIDRSAWLVGSTVVATATLGFFGVEGDGLNRLVRVHPWPLLAGAFLLLGALSIGFMTLGAKDVKRGTMVVGLLSFVAGVALLLGAHAHATATQQRPTVVADLSAGATPMAVKVRLTAAGVKPDEYLFAIVQGASAGTHLDPQRVGPDPGYPEAITNGEYSRQPLYKSRVGPSLVGDIDISVSVPVTEGLYDQIWVKARIISSFAKLRKPDQLSDVEVDDEFELEFGQFGFPCTRQTVGTACAVLLVPDVPKEGAPEKER